MLHPNALSLVFLEGPDFFLQMDWCYFKINSEATMANDTRIMTVLKDQYICCEDIIH